MNKTKASRKQGAAHYRDGVWG